MLSSLQDCIFPVSFSEMCGIRLESSVAGSCLVLPPAQAVSSRMGSAMSQPPLVLHEPQQFWED